MFSKIYLTYMLLFVGILELPSALSYEAVEHEEHVLLNVGWEVRCKLQPNSWNCYKNKSEVVKYYYDTIMQTCKPFNYGGCSFDFNGFTTLSECSDLCNGIGDEVLSPEKLKSLTPEVICRLQHYFGSCYDLELNYYYDVSTRTCMGFSYTGCGGNFNRFRTRELCMKGCGSIMPEYKAARMLDHEVENENVL